MSYAPAPLPALPGAASGYAFSESFVYGDGGWIKLPTWPPLSHLEWGHSGAHELPGVAEEYYRNAPSGAVVRTWFWPDAFGRWYLYADRRKAT